MGFSGQELVEQEKCKLIYANFFDGVQCFDSAKGWLHLATPDYAYNSYDAETKTLTTKTFSVSPVTPTDLANIQRPFIFVSVTIEVSGLLVILTADEYTKERIIPIYYLEACDSYSWDSGLKICIDTYQDQVVTSVSLTSGQLSFINNSIFKYTDITGISKLYKLKTFDKQIITFETEIEPANQYYFPLAYYAEEIPASAERVIVHDYKYAKEYISYDRDLYPCGSVLNEEDYLDFDLIINSVFNCHINHIEVTANDWEFNITMFRSNYTFLNNTLDLDILFFNQDTGTYSTKSYRFDFYDKFGSPIDLETAVDQNNPDYGEFIKNIGTANCSGYFEIYLETIHQENRDINSYGYPFCEGSFYELENCSCAGIDLCLSVFGYSCEECDPETGELFDTCPPGEYCTIFGCRSDTLDSACICSGDYGIDKHPSVRANLEGTTCFSENYRDYKLLKNGDITAKMSFTALRDNGGKSLPRLKFFNLYDLVNPERYDYAGTERTISVKAFICLHYLGYSATTLGAALNADYINLTLEDIYSFAPEASDLKLDWSSNTHNQKGAYGMTGHPCNYIKVSTHTEREGYLTIKYRTNSGHNFIYPNHTNYEVITGAIDTQLCYDDYCEKVKFFGSDQAYSYGLFLEEIPKSGTLDVGC